MTIRRDVSPEERLKTATAVDGFESVADILAKLFGPTLMLNAMMSAYLHLALKHRSEAEIRSVLLDAIEILQAIKAAQAFPKTKGGPQ